MNTATQTPRTFTAAEIALLSSALDREIDVLNSHLLAMAEEHPKHWPNGVAIMRDRLTVAKALRSEISMCTCGHNRAAHSDYQPHGCLADVGTAADVNPRGCHCERYVAAASEEK